jgi:hypothetical protein
MNTYRSVHSKVVRMHKNCASFCAASAAIGAADRDARWATAALAQGSAWSVPEQEEYPYTPAVFVRVARKGLTPYAKWKSAQATETRDLAGPYFARTVLLGKVRQPKKEKAADALPQDKPARIPSKYITKIELACQVNL